MNLIIFGNIVKEILTLTQSGDFYLRIQIGSIQFDNVNHLNGMFLDGLNIKKS